MNLTFKNSGLRPLALFGMLLLLTVCSAVDSRAQIFEAVSGGSGEDAARGGVLFENASSLVPGFISVGESNSFSPNGDYDIYVVRTSLAGGLLWAATYDLGGYDFGRKIARTADTQYVITGFTEDLNNCCMRHNVVLLKIDEFGNPILAMTYGGESKDEGMDIKVTKEPFGTSSREVYYITGWSMSFANGRQDGYIIKTDDMGATIWARIYGDLGIQVLNSCFISNNATGDLYAAGSNNSFTNTDDVWLNRINRNDGSLISSWIYGGTGRDVANSVIELQMVPGFANHIVMAGSTTSVTGTVDAFLMRVLGTTGATQTTHVISGPATTISTEEFFQVVEIRPTAIANQGNLLVCGRFTPSVLGLADGFIGEYGAGVGLPTFWERVYGRQANDGLWGVAVAPGNPTSPSYSAISVGATSSFLVFGGIEEQFWVRANRFGNSGCFNATPPTNHFFPNWPATAVKFCHPMIRVACRAPIVATYNTNMILLCLAPGAIHQGEDPTQQDNTFDPTTGRDGQFGTADIETPTATTETVTMMPNPVRAGETFDVAITRPIGTALTITVTDVKGDRILVNELTSKGDGRITIPTVGWASGAYMVTISDGSKSETTKLIVSE